MDPVARLALSIALILAAAKLGGELAMRLKQPSVLGEMLAGAILGAVDLPFFQGLKSEPNIDMLARIGVPKASPRRGAGVQLGSQRDA